MEAHQIHDLEDAGSIPASAVTWLGSMSLIPTAESAVNKLFQEDYGNEEHL